MIRGGGEMSSEGNGGGGGRGGGELIEQEYFSILDHVVGVGGRIDVLITLHETKLLESIVK